MSNSTPFKKPHPVKESRPRIGIYVSFSGQGGVERMMLNLAQGLLSLGCMVDLITVKTKSTYLASVPAGVRQINLRASHTFGSLLPLAQYLRRERPSALLAAKDRANLVAVAARRLVRVPTRLVVRMGTTVSAALEGKRPLKERFWYLRMRIFYPGADAVVAVSKGVAEDLIANAKLSPSLIHAIPNPVITPHLFSMAEVPLDHPWFRAGGPPVILGIGRLTRQKDFPSLIMAFAKARASVSCRLVILGEGQDRPKLEALATSLGVGSDIWLPGFVQNPYSYLKRAALFVLSSAWEGSPNALTEALALGTPVVSTDCPNGPREILQGGRFGPLVPVGDVNAMARAMLDTLARPLEKSFLKSAVNAYTMEQSSRRYLEVLLGRVSQDRYDAEKYPGS